MITPIIEVLVILRTCAGKALDNRDPSQALAERGNYKTDEGFELGVGVGRKIAIVFSQVTALEGLLEPKQIASLREAESCNDLEPAYEVLIEQLTGKSSIEFFEEFFRNLKEHGDKEILGLLEELEKTNVNKRIREIAESMRSAIKEDGAALNEAFKKTRTFTKGSASVEELIKKSREYREAAAAKLEEIAQELRAAEKTLDEKGINWKMAAAAIGGVCLGMITRNRK